LLERYIVRYYRVKRRCAVDDPDGDVPLACRLECRNAPACNAENALSPTARRKQPAAPARSLRPARGTKRAADVRRESGARRDAGASRESGGDAGMSREEWRELSSRHWPDILDKAAVLCWRLMVIATRLHAVLDPEVLRYGIQPGDFEVLVTLRIHGVPYELSPTAIYRARCLSSGGLTKILHRLKQAQLIARQPDPRDQRSRLVRLTAKGKRAVEAAMDEMGLVERQLLGDFDATERERLGALTDKLMRTLPPSAA